MDRLIDNILPYFIRIKKSDLDIPPATIHPPIRVPMGNIQQRIYDFIEKKYVDSMLSDGSIDTSTRFKAVLAQARMIRLIQAASNPAMLRIPLQEFIDDEDCPQEAFQAIDDSDVMKSILEYENAEIPTKYIATENLVRPLINDFLRKMAKFRHQENQDVNAGTRIRFFIDKPAAMISFPRAVIKYL